MTTVTLDVALATVPIGALLEASARLIAGTRSSTVLLASVDVVCTQDARIDWRRAHCVGSIVLSAIHDARSIALEGRAVIGCLDAIYS
jgi:hypothetical protein